MYLLLCASKVGLSNMRLLLIPSSDILNKVVGCCNLQRGLAPSSAATRLHVIIMHMASAAVRSQPKRLREAA